ncbi:alpha/beta fold hydrolase [Nocardioides campestrisoli]|uniref:alpha/beta fold hydrolase n=1 Tax=Nocardioides campestrisoli TaxID=2736757 RepID=UPI00163D61AD|nr:alpha/beta fold hydrolase [Nocardioides campestrisoli]
MTRTTGPAPARTSLHTTVLGEGEPPVVFCHGLFGQGRNWTQIGKELAADHHRVTLVDLPNHGRSGWTDEVDLVADADRVADLLAEGPPAVLVGHSMGGKVAMLTALRHPEVVERLCVVDIAPVSYRRVGEFAGFIEGMLGLDLTSVERRSDADEQLASHVEDPSVRAFLLQNLRREGDGWRWQANLPLLGEQLGAIGGWPEDRLGDVSPYPGPVLWLAGANSAYVRDEHAPAMERWFPRVRRVTVKNAGHWVHSEQPEVFLAVLRRFIAAGRED